MLRNNNSLGSSSRSGFLGLKGLTTGSGGKNMGRKSGDENSSKDLKDIMSVTIQDEQVSKTRNAAEQ